MAIKVEVDRYEQGYNDGYAAGLKARQSEVEFLMRLVDRFNTQEVYIPFNPTGSKYMGELLRVFKDKEEAQDNAVKRFTTSLKRGCNNELE